MSITEEQIQANNFKDFYNRLKPLLGIKPVSGFTPVGTIIAVMGKTAPNNYIACNGQIVNIKDYPELANYFNEQFGSYNYFDGDGIDTFGIPDLRGEFLRGTGTNGHENQGSGDGVGTHQDATEHIQMFVGTNSTSFYNNNSGNGLSTKNADTDIDAGLKRSSVSTSVGTSTWSRTYYTSRPTNTSVLYCIATKNIYIDVKYDYSTDEKIIGSWIDGRNVYSRSIVDFSQYQQESGTYSNINYYSIEIPSLNISRVIDTEGWFGIFDTANSEYWYSPFPSTSGDWNALVNISSIIYVRNSNLILSFECNKRYQVDLSKVELCIKYIKELD